MFSYILHGHVGLRGTEQHDHGADLYASGRHVVTILWSVAAARAPPLQWLPLAGVHLVPSGRPFFRQQPREHESVSVAGRPVLGQVDDARHDGDTLEGWIGRRHLAFARETRCFEPDPLYVRAV